MKDKQILGLKKYYELILNKKISDLNKINNYIKKLRSWLKLWDNEYYVLNKSSISDNEYDNFIRILKALESSYPNLKTNNSPTNRIGENFGKNINIYKHSEPMLSIDNAFTQSELELFTNRIYKQFGSNVQFTIEPKYDGVSLALIYKNGKLIRALTRGNGYSGEDVSKNIKQIKAIPKQLSSNIDIEIRGECYLLNSNFKKMIVLEMNNTDFKKIGNSRNIVSGLIRKENFGITSQYEKFINNINFYPYTIINPNTYDIYKQSQIFQFCMNNGFEFLDLHKVGYSKNIIDYYKKINDELITDKYNCNMDGIVAKIDSFKIQKQLGHTSKFPRWIIAYKFKEQFKNSVITNYQVTVGKSGRITYVGILKPIILDNTCVSRVMMNNYNYINKKEIFLNSIVTIKKSGGIIPKIIAVCKSSNDITIKKEIICPSCASPLIDVGEEQYCCNINCKEQIINKLIFFCSKNALDIDGMGNKIITYFYDNNIIQNIADIYKLKNKYDKLIKISFNGRVLSDKILANLLSEIERSKSKNFSHFLTGFSIKGIGKNRANDIANYFRNINNLLLATEADYFNINNLALKTIHSIQEFFINKNNLKVIHELENVGIKLEQKNNDKISKHHFKGKVFVISGSLSQSRNFFENLIKINGGKISSAITKKTDYLLIGNKPGIKLDKAKKANIKVINEENFNKILK